MSNQQDQTMVDVLKNLHIKWVVRQQVRTVEKAWLVDIFDSDSERVARNGYDRLVRDNPDAYFELVSLIHSEVCRLFTPYKGATSSPAEPTAAPE